jgi:hypothetical protein
VNVVALGTTERFVESQVRPDTVETVVVWEPW